MSSLHSFYWQNWRSWKGRETGLPEAWGPVSVSAATPAESRGAESTGARGAAPSTARRRVLTARAPSTAQPQRGAGRTLRPGRAPAPPQRTPGSARKACRPSFRSSSRQVLPPPVPRPELGAVFRGHVCTQSEESRSCLLPSRMGLCSGRGPAGPFGEVPSWGRHSFPGALCSVPSAGSGSAGPGRAPLPRHAQPFPAPRPSVDSCRQPQEFQRRKHGVSQRSAVEGSRTVLGYIVISFTHI